VQSDARPFCGASQNNQGNLSSGEILLKLHSPVSRQEHFYAGIFRCVE